MCLITCVSQPLAVNAMLHAMDNARIKPHLTKRLSKMGNATKFWQLALVRKGTIPAQQGLDVTVTLQSVIRVAKYPFNCPNRIIQMK